MDRQTFGHAYEDGFSSTRYFLMSRGLSRQQAEESAQAAWARGWERRSHLKDPSALQTWVNVIALNHFRNSLRVDGRSQELPPDLHAPSGKLEPLIDSRRILQACRPKDRELMWAFYGEGFTSEELAQDLGVTPTAVRVRLLRARQSLRKTRAPR